MPGKLLAFATALCSGLVTLGVAAPVWWPAPSSSPVVVNAALAQHLLLGPAMAQPKGPLAPDAPALHAADVTVIESTERPRGQRGQRRAARARDLSASAYLSQPIAPLVTLVERTAAASLARSTPTSTTPTPAPSPQPEPEPAPPATTRFVLSSFNILGSQHTAKGPMSRRFAGGRIRAGWAADLIKARNAEIVGLQEVQGDQLDVLNRATGGTYDFYPGRALGAKGVPQSLMWRKDRWSRVSAGSISIPFVGQVRPQPWVRLRNVGTGAEIIVVNVHNSPNHRERERDIAQAREIALVNKLRRDTGLPVFLIGDFNEHGEAFCTFTRSAGLVTPAGGSNSGTCRPPRAMRVDWIFGPSSASYSGYVADRGPAVRRITDHAVLFTNVTLG